ncbi:MAG: HRDC domain-containing protein [Actinomycetota bacterium]|nr:HRDC domain-containing protein [Actinomycetota bacterium]
MEAAHEQRGLTPAELAGRARDHGRLAIDTEFVSEGRYRPLLCLVQVAVAPRGAAGEPEIEVLDPIDGFDHEPLAEVLADPEVEVIIHAGGQDVPILRRAWGVGPTNVFDTQVAAGFAGFSAQAGYGNLLAKVSGVQLSKSAGFTRWDRRPLTREQLEYARSDVEDLLQLSDTLQERLAAAGRLEWAREECRRLESIDDTRDADEAYRRLPRVNRLRARQRAAAYALADWRERTAQSEDRPVGSILSDVALVEIARRQPDSLEALSAIRGVRPDVGRKRGNRILEVGREGRDREAPALAESARPEPDPTDSARIALCEAVVRQRVGEAGLAYELVASRADLTEIVVAARSDSDEPDVRTLRGWRRDLVGSELLDVLAGRRTVRASKDGVEIAPAG